MQTPTENDPAKSLTPVAPSDPAMEHWFDAPPSSSRRPSAPPPASVPVKVGEFLGDPVADAWLR